jgi:hypothetical protein
MNLTWSNPANHKLTKATKKGGSTVNKMRGPTFKKTKAPPKRVSHKGNIKENLRTYAIHSLRKSNYTIHCQFVLLLFFVAPLYPLFIASQADVLLQSLTRHGSFGLEEWLAYILTKIQEFLWRKIIYLLNLLKFKLILGCILKITNWQIK